MKQISINNGHSFCTIEEALAEFSIDTIAHYMDDDTREAVARKFTGKSDAEFISEYLKSASEDIVIG